MIVLYGTPRALLQIRTGSTVKGHGFRPLFSLQVWYVCCCFAPCLRPCLTRPRTHPLTHSFVHCTFFFIEVSPLLAGVGHARLLCHPAFCQATTAFATPYLATLS